MNKSNKKKVKPYVVGNWLCFGYLWNVDDAIELFIKIYNKEPKYTIYNKRYGLVIGDVDVKN